MLLLTPRTVQEWSDRRVGVQGHRAILVQRGHFRLHLSTFYTAGRKPAGQNTTPASNAETKRMPSESSTPTRPGGGFQVEDGCPNRKMRLNITIQLGRYPVIVARVEIAWVLQAVRLRFSRA